MEDKYAQDVPFLSAPSTIQNALIGPCVAGYQVQFILFGILIQQYIAFLDNSKAHSRLSKWTAAIVVGLNVAYTAICFEDGYNLAASSDRKVLTLFNGSVEWQFLPLLNGFIAATAEGFLTLRAGAFFMNQKAKWAFYVWQGCLIVLVLFGACAAFAEGVVGYYKPYDNDVIDYNLASSLWLWACAAADCSVSIALAYNLSKRIANFNQATDSVLRKLILIGLRTASFTAILSIGAAIISSMYSGWDPTKVDIPIALWCPTSALYGISLFTTLSSTRQVVEKRLGSSPSNTTKPAPQLSARRSFVSGIPRLSNHPDRHPVIPLEINVHQEVVRNVDIDEEEKSSGSRLSGSYEKRDHQRARIAPMEV